MSSCKYVPVAKEPLFEVQRRPMQFFEQGSWRQALLYSISLRVDDLWNEAKTKRPENPFPCIKMHIAASDEVLATYQKYPFLNPPSPLPKYLALEDDQVIDLEKISDTLKEQWSTLLTEIGQNDVIIELDEHPEMLSAPTTVWIINRLNAIRLCRTAETGRNIKLFAVSNLRDRGNQDYFRRAFVMKAIPVANKSELLQNPHYPLRYVN